ncbi:hypothetical protein D7319_02570 [Streptomyces radicis]|uniref:Uncharacterized protein n=1 Tax=Streptomyces radicis TaxID=1750517 RepID=A0A3A9WTH1_9ACTN|nr:hypothetical protein D7319_02570 [Streptomyces radicis]RKN27401.1 hypothetical protein D7318_00325 [Streptomyces radicis]
MGRGSRSWRCSFGRVGGGRGRGGAAWGAAGRGVTRRVRGLPGPATRCAAPAAPPGRAPAAASGR